MYSPQANVLPLSPASSRYTTSHKKYLRDMKTAEEKEALTSARSVESQKLESKFENRVQTWSTFGTTIANEFSMPVVEPKQLFSGPHLGDALSIIAKAVIGKGICGDVYYVGSGERHDGRRNDVVYYPLVAPSEEPFCEDVVVYS
ncbi:hypothetical protein INT47_004623 [Mucor saturninus]|uniref:Uncharacterized protein n=1 Tax=Mucor saturninus TaxID=64648 RepID=A0A8H7RLP3_9FUNG|nr:hypothetical protein INT47_004623 [Mucor saturninus]